MSRYQRPLAPPPEELPPPNEPPPENEEPDEAPDEETPEELERVRFGVTMIRSAS